MWPSWEGMHLRGSPPTTALAAVLAFIPLTHSVFWRSMAYTIGGTAVGTVLILLLLPALYAAWFRIKLTADDAKAPNPISVSHSRESRASGQSVVSAGAQ